MRLHLPSSCALSLAILTSSICQSIAGSPLHEILFNDFLSMGSSDECAGSPDTTNISFDFTASPESEWSNVNKNKESQTFFAEMMHEDTADSSQSWAVRFGPGGNIYSLKGAEYGESIPPQTKARAAWVDEVTQSVAVDIYRNKPGYPWYIHQAGTYQYDDEYLNQSFYSPSLASHCEGDTCIFASWGQQAWVPTVYKSPAMYIHRYRNCGGGRIEYTQGFVNFADPVDGPNLYYLNMPWAGVRTSKLPDLYWSRSDGTMDTKIQRADIPGWGNDKDNMPELRSSGGFTTFGEDRSEDEAMALSYVHGKDPTFGVPGNNWYRAPSRARCGMSGRDFTVFTVNGRINFPPQHIYINRSFLISGKLKDMETKAAELVPDAYVDMTNFNELGSEGRKLEIYSEGQDYGVAFASEQGGTIASCARGTSVCEGSTVPKNGLKPHYAITCGDSVYFGPDMYFFSPPRVDTGDYLTSEPIRSYACVNEGIGVFPKFTLLGFFPDNGECTSLQSSNYDDSFCPVATAQPTSNPTTSPTNTPTSNPTPNPTTTPTNSPTSNPTAPPTTLEPTAAPTTAMPTASPTTIPTSQPTDSPTVPPPYNFDIVRSGDVRITNSTDATEKIIAIDYELADSRLNHDDVNITIFEEDCSSVLGLDVLPRTESSVGQIVTLGVVYNYTKVERSSIWNAAYNDDNVEIGGNFTFCVRAATVDEQSTYNMDFNETKFFVDVKKTTGAGFNLAVDIDRDEAGDENAGTVDYSGSVNGFQCNVAAKDFEEKNVAVGQGESLGLCVESTTAGITVIGWQSLTLSRDGINFDAIQNGNVPTTLANLVDTTCGNDRCDAEVELIALFFQSDGNLTVDGTVVLGIDGSSTRRQLTKVKTEVTRGSDEKYATRRLEEGDDAGDAAQGSFVTSISVVSDTSTPSGSITFGPSYYLFCLMSLTLIIVTNML